LDLISTDIVPSAREELASSPSSSETSMAKENRLFGESCSGKEEKRLVKDKYKYYKLARSISLPVSRQFLAFDWRKWSGVCRVEDQLSLPMGCSLWSHQ
jgi:hypothetical protein